MQNLSKSWLQAILRPMLVGFLTLIFAVGITGCTRSDANVFVDLVSLARQQSPKNLIQLQEVSPPALLEDLRSSLSQYEPQLKIISPTPNAILEDTTIAVNFEIQDYPLFKDPDLGLGPHIHVFLDDRPYTAIYNTAEPLILENLEPGTHTLRAFASRPWHESFKNEGAYAQVTFHVFTETADNTPNPDLPLLTYSRPQSTYGAEPILLDFYLTNAPLHFLASADPEDDIPDWRIRATINGESFLIDRWEPIYLTGFKEGVNWVKLELLGEDGEPIVNAFNTTARLIEYYPGGTDALSRLVRGEVDREAALAIVLPPNPQEAHPEQPPEQSLEPSLEQLSISESSLTESNLTESNGTESNLTDFQGSSGTLQVNGGESLTESSDESSDELLTESPNLTLSFDRPVDRPLNETDPQSSPETIGVPDLTAAQTNPISPDLETIETTSEPGEPDQIPEATQTPEPQI